ncbi:MAG: hypothetical protein CME61_07090 [Halobacteriovoraceae bacterium]|nr:hypothetical protein [Halobacteriovoraceae bacterium]
MKNTILPYKKHSILFAPMEGITDPAYRKTVMELYPEWDMFATDFLRVPTEGYVTEKKVIEHFGEEIYNDPIRRDKTTYQILTTPRANTEQTLEVINALEFKHLDLNIGCPSRRVNAHQGGSFLLTDVKLLEEVVSLIRKKTNKTFTTKIRVGFHDDKNFDDIIRCLDYCGVDGITIHGRTRVEMYKGTAQWKYFSRATKLTNLPIIANGDIWTPEDIETLFSETDVYAVMCARSAMKTPWLAKDFQLKKEISYTKSKRLANRLELLPYYFSALETNYREAGMEDAKVLKKMKALIRYILDDFENGEVTKKKMLRSLDYSHFKEIFSESKNDLYSL